MSNSELQTLSKFITVMNDINLVQLVLFKQVVTTLLQRYATSQHINLDSQINMLNACVESHIKQHNISQTSMQNALDDVVQVSQTSQILASLPK